jgi:uncharacterized protein with PIN domain
MAALTDQIRLAEPEARATTARELWRRSSTRAAVADPLRVVLQRMSPGVERCMYCGESLGTDVDHHEPVVRNPLRTFDWLNHLLACSHCNSHHKRDAFPVDGQGRPLLIDPTAEDPFDHLLLAFSAGEYLALTEKGQSTLDVCGLNRFTLTRARQQARRVVVQCLRLWRHAMAENDEDQIAELVQTIREQPCADVCQAMLRQVELPGANTVFAEVLDVVELLREPGVRAALLLSSS